MAFELLTEYGIGAPAEKRKQNYTIVEILILDLDYNNDYYLQLRKIIYFCCITMMCSAFQLMLEHLEVWNNVVQEH